MLWQSQSPPLWWTHVWHMLSWYLITCLWSCTMDSPGQRPLFMSLDCCPRVMLWTAKCYAFLVAHLYSSYPIPLSLSLIKGSFKEYLLDCKQMPSYCLILVTFQTSSLWATLLKQSSKAVVFALVPIIKPSKLTRFCAAVPPPRVGHLHTVCPQPDVNSLGLLTKLSFFLSESGGWRMLAEQKRDDSSK